eukprot:2701999-Ditylum_brightwellii.AAC.1
MKHMVPHRRSIQLAAAAFALMNFARERASACQAILSAAIFSTKTASWSEYITCARVATEFFSVPSLFTIHTIDHSYLSSDVHAISN